MISPVYKIVNPVHKIIWRQIPPLKDEILPYYLISNTGLVYDAQTNRYLNFNMAHDGYISIRLRTINGSITRRVHRLVMMTFCPIDNCELYEVNHIDGVKTHNQVWNLEWVNHDENMKHASRTGLFVVRGESRENTKLTENQVRLICEKISEGKPPKQISEEMNLKDCNINKIAKNITNRASWKHISKDYDFSNSFKREFLFTKEEVHQICKYFEENGRETSTDEILDYLGIVPKSFEDRRRYQTALSPIRNKKNYINICNQYNY